MRIIRFLYRGKKHWGIPEGDTIRFLKSAPFEKIRFVRKKAELKEIELLPPAEPSKIVLIGLNYKDHAQELNMPLPEEPLIFLKPASSIIGAEDEIVYPDSVGELDYEAELAVIIKKKCKDVPPEDAWKYILGYTCLNDVTARDLQKKDGQWTRAKSFDTFCPIGPWIETDLNPSNLHICSYLNSEIKQNSSTSNFIFPVPEIISFISKIMTLLPGDIVSTGTPPGVGQMYPGDTIEIEIEGIGRLRNYVRRNE